MDFYKHIIDEEFSNIKQNLNIACENIIVLEKLLAEEIKEFHFKVEKYNKNRKYLKYKLIRTQIIEERVKINKIKKNIDYIEKFINKTYNAKLKTIDKTYNNE